MATKGQLTSFMRFLQRENVYEAYFKNFNDNKSAHWREKKLVGNSLKIWPPLAFLKYSFLWAATTEGYDFWLRIDKKWKEHIINKSYV